MLIQSLSFTDFDSAVLYLSELDEQDVPALFHFYADAEAMKHRGSAPMKTVGDAFELIKNLHTYEKGTVKSRYAVRRKADKQLVGTLLLAKEDDMPGEYEIGFSFGKQFWGNGYATQTLKMVERGLLAANAVLLKAWCKRGNKASIKVFKNADFEEKTQELYPDSILLIKQFV